MALPGGPSQLPNDDSFDDNRDDNHSLNYGNYGPAIPVIVPGHGSCPLLAVWGPTALDVKSRRGGRCQSITLPGKSRGGLSVRMGRKQRMTERIKHGRPTSVHRQLQVIDNGAHPPTFCGIGEPEFIELPTIFVIL
jgi:hypothetical protein